MSALSALFCRISFLGIALLIAMTHGWAQQMIERQKDLVRLEQLERKVLRKSRPGKAYTANVTGQKSCNRTRYVYLGAIECIDGNRYRLMTQFQVVGYSCRGISRLWVYDHFDKPVGNYKFDMPYELPVALERGELVFRSNDPDCFCHEEVRIPFGNNLQEVIDFSCSDPPGSKQFYFEREQK